MPAHVLHSRHRHVEQPAYVDVEGAVPLLVVDVLDGGAQVDTGVVDEHLHPPQRGGGGVEGGAGLLAAPDGARHALRVGAAGAQGLHRLRQGVLVAVQQREARATRGEQLRAGAADARRRPRDEDARAVQAFAHALAPCHSHTSSRQPSSVWLL